MIISLIPTRRTTSCTPQVLTAIKGNWFPTYRADVFISHSHKDEEKVIALAGWLNEKFDLNVFIDSCVWGYCNDLLKAIDNKYCLNEKKDAYDYDLRNYTTSHVHMMLSMALTDMIDLSECIIFFNTPSSVEIKRDIETLKNIDTKITLSPWIYNELAISNKLRPHYPHRDSIILEHRYSHSSGPMEIEYGIGKYLSGFEDFDENDLQEWENMYLKSNIHALDVIYKYIEEKKGYGSIF